MKKLVLMLAVVFSVSLFSCGNGNEGSKSDTTDTTKVSASCSKDVKAPASTSGETPAPTSDTIVK